MDNFDEIVRARSLKELAGIMHRRLECDGVLVSEVRCNESVALAEAGALLPDRFKKSMPLSHSICRHCTAMNFPLAIDDTIGHPLLSETKAFEALGIVAYLGAPIHRSDGHAFGAICALERKYRRWTEDEIASIVFAATTADQLIAASK